MVTGNGTCQMLFCLPYRNYPSLLYPVTNNIVQSKHNNIFNNVKLLHVSGTINHHQADISINGHDVFTAIVWDPILLTFAVRNFRHRNDKLLNILIS
jgi:hypothetical protein